MRRLSQCHLSVLQAAVTHHPGRRPIANYLRAVAVRAAVILTGARVERRDDLEITVAGQEVACLLNPSPELRIRYYFKNVIEGWCGSRRRR